MREYAEQQGGVAVLAQALTEKDSVVGDGSTLIHLATVHCNVTVLEKILDVLEEAQWVDGNEALVAQARGLSSNTNK